MGYAENLLNFIQYYKDLLALSSRAHEIISDSSGNMHTNVVPLYLRYL